MNVKNSVGLWIDHRKAVIVSLTEAGAPGGYIAGVETVDRMTRRQLASILRRRFA